MTIRTWLAAAIAAVTLTALSAPSLADSRGSFERMPSSATRAPTTRVAQARPDARMGRAQPAPAASRTKSTRADQAPSRGARQAGSTSRPAKARR